MKSQKIKLPKIFGSDFADIIIGSSNPKQINGLAGGDTLLGYGAGSKLSATPKRRAVAGMSCISPSAPLRLVALASPEDSKNVSGGPAYLDHVGGR